MDNQQKANAKTRRREDAKKTKKDFYFSSLLRVFAPSRLRVCVFFCCITAISVGCDRSANVATARPVVAAGSCVVRGVVKFDGPTPAPKVIGGECCQGSAPVMDESLVVGESGGLKNVVVFIKDGPNLDLAMGKDRVLTQRNCQYVPHVMAVRAGQNVVVSNHDATMHNVLMQQDGTEVGNLEEIPQMSHAVHFDQPGLVRFKCNVHAWMTGYVYVFDHPCFAVTDENGRFEIGNLPAGTYTLVAWQEKVGSQEMTVTVGGDKPAEVTIVYHP
jgi:plastocyanin